MKLSSLFSKRFRLGSYSLVVCAVVLAVVILLNIIVSALPSKFTTIDVTSSELSEIGETTENFLSGITDSVTLYLIVSEGSEDSILVNLLRHYAEASDHVTYTKIDPATNPTFLTRYDADSVGENSVIVVNSSEEGSTQRFRTIDNSSLYLYYIDEFGDYFSYDEANYYYSMYYQYYGTALTITQYFQAEKEITTAIEYVTATDLPKVYALTGHGEANVDSSIQSLMTQSNIEFSADFSILSYGSIPNDASAIIINQPTKDLSEDEKNVLLSFIENDGNVLLVTSYEGGNYEENTPNLMAICHAMGMEMTSAFVCDSNKSYYTNFNRYFALLPKACTEVGPFTHYDPTNQTFLFLSSHPILLIENYEGEANVSGLLSTSSEGYLKVNPSSSLTKQDDDPVGKYYIGAIATLNDEDEDGDVGTFAWYSTAYIEQDYYANQDLYMATISWLTGKSTSLAIGFREMEQSQMDVLSADTQLAWSATIIFIIPIAFLCVGFGVWYRRRRR